MTLVDKTKLESVIMQTQNCMEFAAICKNRVELLEAHRGEVAKHIDNLVEETELARQEAAWHKKKNNVLLPGAALALGIFAGFLIKR